MKVPELGQIVSGRVPEEPFDVPRSSPYDSMFFALCEMIGWETGDPPYECDLFTIRTYYWGDCTCGADDAAWAEPDKPSPPHDPKCPCVLPNFEVRIPGGGVFTLSWYKYPMRGAYMSHNLDEKQWIELMKLCYSAVLK